MGQAGATRLVERIHRLPAAEREMEKAVLEGLARRSEHFVGDRREAFDAMTMMTPVAAGVDLVEVDEADARGWWVLPPGAPRDRAVLLLHGGGYVLGSAKAYRGFASQVAARTGAATFVLDYPLAPEHPFPAAPEAVSTALGWLARDGRKRVSIVGDSAGGGLAFGALARATGDRPEVASVVAFSPWVDLTLASRSATEPSTVDPIFRRDVLAAVAASYLAGTPADDPRASPINAVLHALPPIAIQVGTDELLLDDARSYAKLAAARGGEVRLDVFEGLHHVFQRCTEALPAARRAFDLAGVFIMEHWD